MFLRNFDNIMTCLSTPTPNGGVFGEVQSFTDGSLAIKKTDGSLHTPIKKTNGDVATYPFGTVTATNEYSWSGSTTFIMGGGDTSVTYDDYKMASLFDSNKLSVNSTTYGELVYNSDDKCFERTVTMKYVAVNDITIKEIGFVTTVSDNSSTQIGKPPVLIYREVIEPISVPINTTIVVTAVIKSSANNNKPLVSLSVG